jgi:hypothetical protein
MYLKCTSLSIEICRPRLGNSRLTLIYGFLWIAEICYDLLIGDT